MSEAEPTEAQRVAATLTLRFLAQGSFTSGAPMSGAAVDHLYPAVADGGPDISPLFTEHGFAGLAVQAVGYEVGVPEPRVHVYVSKGSRRAIESVPTDEGEVEVEVNRIGKLVLRPERPLAATNRGQLFERKGRIACGSSCAPSKEGYSGTFGALARKGSERTLFILSNNHVLAACNHTPVGMPILSPSNSDARPDLRAPGEIARHSEICELRSGAPALVDPCRGDLAIAKVTQPGTIDLFGNSNDWLFWK
jgi:hypothetical protein